VVDDAAEALPLSRSVRKGGPFADLLKNSAFGWRSASSAAVNALESAKALAAEVAKPTFPTTTGFIDNNRFRKVRCTRVRGTQIPRVSRLPIPALLALTRLAWSVRKCVA